MEASTLCRPHSLPDCEWCRRDVESARITPTDSRAAFEAHFKLCIRQQARYSVGDYRDSSIQDKWLGWQAAKGEWK